MKDYFKESLSLHQKLKGKISINTNTNVDSTDDLSLVYSPGVAEPCKEIAQNPALARIYTIKNNSVAVVSDGSAVLGLGNIGALASIPVMEGKAMLFKKFAGIDAFPICLDTQDTDEIIETVKRIAPVFGGINLEDIAAPKCFEVEDKLQDLGIPVFHDDQHGTAIVVMAALINASKLTGKSIGDLKIVINGAGSAGVAISKLLKGIDIEDENFDPVKEIIVCDSKGIICNKRDDLNPVKQHLLKYSNDRNITGSLRDALEDADVFIGVSVAGALKAADVALMKKNPIILALANPIPEIMPDEAKKAGVAVIATGRSDFPNQVNNVLAFPGIFRGALDAGAKRITNKMKLAAARAIAGCIDEPSADKIIPSSLDRSVAEKVAHAVYQSTEK